MFECEFCARTFSMKHHLKRHGDCRPVLRKCLQCSGVYKSEGALERHLKEKHPVPKRKAEETPLIPMAKRTRLDQENQKCIQTEEYRKKGSNNSTSSTSIFIPMDEGFVVINDPSMLEEEQEKEQGMDKKKLLDRGVWKTFVETPWFFWTLVIVKSSVS